MVTVGLVKGDDRFGNVLQALANAGESVKQKIRGRVVIKINTVMEDELLANTHPEGLRAVLEFLKPLNLDRVVVGEASCKDEGLFRKCGYAALQDSYGFDLLDFSMLATASVKGVGTSVSSRTARENESPWRVY